MPEFPSDLFNLVSVAYSCASATNICRKNVNIGWSRVHSLVAEVLESAE